MRSLDRGLGYANHFPSPAVVGTVLVFPYAPINLLFSFSLALPMKRTSWLFLVPVLLFSLISSHQAQAQRRWSPQGKGAAIGGAAGILGGALINKRNRVVGGAIGGVAGAGVGYGVGKHIDNKRKKAAALAAERAAANRRIAAANARADAAERAAAERRSVASNPGSIARVAGATTLAAAAGVAGAQALAPASQPSNSMVASGFMPNPQYGQADAAYPTAEVRRKSW